jgi:hypothetical protein
MAMGAPGKITKKKKTKKPMTFGQTFAKNRKAGKATFTYKGKKYSTKTKAEVTKKASLKQGRAIKKKARVGRTNTTMKQRMAARKKGRVAARKNRRLNRALRK